MPFFTSTREQRLWSWALLVLVAIYATLGPARVLVDALRERNLLRASFFALLAAVVATIAVRWIRQRPTWPEIGVAFGVALAYGMALLRIDNPAERTHLIEYGVVAGLVHAALLERGRHGAPVTRPAAVAITATALLGLGDEVIQYFLPGRVFDWIDVLFNAFAGFMVVAARLAMAPVRGPGWRLWFLWSVTGAVGWGWVMDTGFGDQPRIVVVASLPGVSLPLAVSIVVGGVLVGGFQAIVLRRYLPAWRQWFVASAVPSLLIMALLLAGARLRSPDALLVLAVGYGALLGGSQWLLMRTTLARAGWWPPVSTVAWWVTIPMADVMGPPGWAIFGAITGAMLVLLLRLAGGADRHALE